MTRPAPAPPPAPPPAPARDAVDRFHQAFYYARLWERVRFMGVPAFKCPLDLWVYQEILHETRPDVIIETGTAHGGAALFLATVCDVLQRGRVITVDIREQRDRPAHARIAYITGSSVDRATVERVRGLIAPHERVMVILDSLHTRDHVLAELHAYAPLVTRGCYLIVEDTNINGHPVTTDYQPDQGPGPAEAVGAFLAGSDRFETDRSREKFLLTFNPGGYLRCVK